MNSVNTVDYVVIGLYAGLMVLVGLVANLTIGNGFLLENAVEAVAKKNPNNKFLLVDSLLVDDKGNPYTLPNVRTVTFKENEGSFLVGALAGLASKTGKVGFVGGMEVPLIKRFEAGYRAGVKHVCPDCTVIAQYAGVTPEAFRNPGRGKELALSQYQSGVNIIFHASGSTGLGVFEAARSSHKLAIGVDADQFAEAPGYVLTSMVKGVDAAVFDAIRRAKDGSFRGGIYQFGLAEGGVGYVYDANNRALIPDSVRTRLQGLQAEIVAGKITVPSTR